MDNENNHTPGDGQVGYSKPPQHTRFKKGKSGNPTGRPKGTKNLATTLERILREKVVINENGMRKTVTKLEAALKQVVNQAASGDLLAMRLLNALVNSVGTAAPVDAKSTAPADVDQKIMNRLLEKLEKSRRIKDDDDK